MVDRIQFQFYIWNNTLESLTLFVENDSFEKTQHYSDYNREINPTHSTILIYIPKHPISSEKKFIVKMRWNENLIITKEYTFRITGMNPTINIYIQENGHRQKFNDIAIIKKTQKCCIDKNHDFYTLLEKNKLNDFHSMAGKELVDDEKQTMISNDNLSGCECIQVESVISSTIPNEETKETNTSVSEKEE
jgi:hypothetical protein